MSWIADYDTHGREFPTCVHVTKTAGGMTHGVTYVPIQDGKDVRAENAKLRKLVQSADGLLTGIFPYVDYSRCTAPEAIAEWRTEAVELGVVK